MSETIYIPMLVDREALLPPGISLAFCPTGPGGGVDPHCGKGGGGSGAKPLSATELAHMRDLKKMDRLGVKLPKKARDKLKDYEQRYTEDAERRAGSQAAPPIPIKPASAPAPLPVPAPAEPNVYKPWTAEIGMKLYHASPDPIDELDDERPMWFTPSRKEGDAYLRNSEGDNPRSYETTLKVKNFATQKQAESIMREVFGKDSEFNYAMLDASVGEEDEKDVHSFISKLKSAGFAGVIHSDYSAVDQERDAFTLFAFHPKSATTGLKQRKSVKLSFPAGISLAFCPTGEGGGIDNSCGSTSGGLTSSSKTGEIEHVDPKDVKLIDVNIGGTQGAKLVEWEGQRFVAKDYGGGSAHAAERVANEHLANELFNELADEAISSGAPESQIIQIGNHETLMSPFVANAKPLGELKGLERDAAERRVAKDFVVDAYLANWDSVGTGADNVLAEPGGHFTHRVDNGGALLFRATGAEKGAAFGPTVPELTTMRDPTKNHDAAKVFGKLTDAQVAKQARALVQRASPSKIKSIVDNSQLPKDLKERVANVLIARRYWLAARYPAQ